MAASWEDWDEWPWRTLPNGPAVVQIAGFDPADHQDPGLDLGDLVIGRVEILAVGRYRSYFESRPEEGPEAWQESWLLRWWPEEPGLPEVNRSPRRVREAYRRRNEFLDDVYYLRQWDDAQSPPPSPEQLSARLGVDPFFAAAALREEPVPQPGEAGSPEVLLLLTDGSACLRVVAGDLATPDSPDAAMRTWRKGRIEITAPPFRGDIEWVFTPEAIDEWRAARATLAERGESVIAPHGYQGPEVRLERRGPSIVVTVTPRSDVEPTLRYRIFVLV